MGELGSIIAAGVSLLGSVIVALVAWGWRSEIGMLRESMATLKAETRAAIAESANDFYRQVNGSYVKKELHNTLAARVDSVENRINDMGD